jgi:hypothetical protein
MGKRRTVTYEGKQYKLPAISPGRQSTLEQRLQIAELVCTMYASDQYTIEECTNKAGITFRTWRQWVNEISQISELYQKAIAEKDAAYKHRIKERARTALERSIEGYKVETKELSEVVTESGIVTLQKVKEQYVKPNPTLIIFALSNTDKENFKRSPENETTINNQFNVQVNTPGPARSPRTSEGDIEDPGSLEDVIQVKGLGDGE